MSRAVYCLLLLGLIKVGAAIKITRMEVPNHQVVGKTVVLRCIYDMESTDLYSIKWYKNGAEFYTYLPKDDPKARVYVVPGINVDVENSDHNMVTLNSVQLVSSGNYKCEVSGEAPYFTTVFQEKEMNVIDLPEDGPKITGSQPKYEVGETVKVNCTSYKSKPGAMLTWTVNGGKMSKKHLREFPSSVDENGLETSVLGLEFQVEDNHFPKGEMKLKCTASIAPIYHQSNEESVIGSNQQASVLESKETPSQTSSGTLILSGSIWFYDLIILTLLLLR